MTFILNDKYIIIINDFISVAQLDFLFLTETWLKPGNQAQLLELCPPKYDSFSSPRTTGRGEDIKKNFLNAAQLLLNLFLHLRPLCLKFAAQNQSYV